MNPGSTVVCVPRVHAFKMIYIEDTWSPKCVSRVHITLCFQGTCIQDDIL